MWPGTGARACYEADDDDEYLESYTAMLNIDVIKIVSSNIGHCSSGICLYNHLHIICTCKHIYVEIHCLCFHKL